MDKKKLEEMREPPAMKMARENQARLDKLSLANGATDNLLKISKDLGYFKRLTEHTATQGLLSKLSRTSALNNLTTDNYIAKIVKNWTELNSLNTTLSEAINLNKYSIDTTKLLQLGFKPPTQSISIKGIAPTSQVGELSIITSKITETFKQYEQFKQYSSFDVLSNLDIDLLIDVFKTSLTTGDIEEFSESSLAENESDLSDEVKSGKHFSSYSEKDKKYLSYAFHTYLLPVLFIVFGILIAPHIQQAQKELKILITQKEIRAFTRSAPINFDRNALKGYRFTIINNLDFRDKPSMKSNVIDYLPIGTTVRVIDKSDRSWLLVEVEINSELEQGWILRRYTTYFK